MAMKPILFYIANARIPTDRAHGIQIMKMCEAFAREGFAVRLIVPRRRNPIATDPFDFYTVARIFPITRLFAADIIGSGRVWFTVETIVFSISVFLFLLLHPKGAVYSRDELPACAAILAGHKTFWESHTGKYNFVIRKLLSRLSGFIVISEGLRDRYIRFGVSKPTIMVAHDAAEGVFSEKFDRDGVRISYAIPTDSFLIMYTGRLSIEKGIYTLLEASETFPKSAVLVVVGEGDALASLRTQYPRVHFLGHVTHSETLLLQRAADLLVIPNSAVDEVSHSLTSPMKLFEYIASGVPVLAADVPSIRVVVGDNNVLWFTPDDSKSLATQVRLHATTPSVGADAALRAQGIAQGFTWNVRAKEISAFMATRGIMCPLTQSL